jgi:hypothetical protein
VLANEGQRHKMGGLPDRTRGSGGEQRFHFTDLVVVVDSRSTASRPPPEGIRRGGAQIVAGGRARFEAGDESGAIDSRLTEAGGGARTGARSANRRAHPETLFGDRQPRAYRPIRACDDAVRGG